MMEGDVRRDESVSLGASAEEVEATVCNMSPI